MRRQLSAAVRLLLIATVGLGLAYPLGMTGLAQAVFPHQADGSLVRRDGHVVGSSLLGQGFDGETYFQPRPSAAGPLASGSMVDGAPADPDDPALGISGASNQGPTNPDLLDAIEARAAAYRQENDLAPDVAIPSDAVTASASGVDPHISVANAALQAPRVAAARGLDLAVVRHQIDEHTDGRSLGFLGDPGVNVLALNLALDDLGSAG